MIYSKRSQWNVPFDVSAILIHKTVRSAEDVSIHWRCEQWSDVRDSAQHSTPARAPASND